MNSIDKSQIQAIRLIAGNCAGRNQRASVLISRAAGALLASGFIAYSPGRRAGYAVTPAGRAIAGINR